MRFLLAVLSAFLWFVPVLVVLLYLPDHTPGWIPWAIIGVNVLGYAEAKVSYHAN